MDVSLRNNYYYNNLLNDKNLLFNSSKKFNLSYNNKDNVTKFSNSKKEIYEKKNLISLNIENKLGKQYNNNEYQNQKIYIENPKNKNSKNNKMFKNNFSEINIYDKRGQNNNSNNKIKLVNDKKYNNDINKNIIINSQGENKINKNYNISNNSYYNTDNNNTFQTLNNNSNEKEQINKTDISSKNKNEINLSNNIINNFNSYKKQDYIDINSISSNYKKNNQVKSEYKDKIENNHSANNIHNYYQSNTDLQIKKSLYNNLKEKSNDKDNAIKYNNLNKMINSVNIESFKDKINNRLKKNISSHYENSNEINSFKIKKSDLNNDQKVKYINIKDIMNDNRQFLTKNNTNIIKNKISPNKNPINYINKVKTNICNTSSNNKNKTNFSLNNKQIISSPQITNENKYKDNFEERSQIFNKKNLSINLYGKDITSTPNNKNINNYNHVNRANNSSYSKSISGSSSSKQYKNNENDYKSQNQNRGRILMNNNKINELNSMSLKREDNNILKMNKLTKNQNINNLYDKNFIYDNNKNQNPFYKNDSDRNRKEYGFYISPDKNIDNDIEKKKDNNNIDYRILSSVKSNDVKHYINDMDNKNKNDEYLNQGEKIYKNTNLFIINKEWNNINITYPYKTSIFKEPKSNTFDENKNVVDYKKEENLKSFKIKINKNISNLSKSSKDNEYDNDFEHFNMSERFVEKEKKKVGTDNRTKIIKKKEIKNVYSPNININYNINNDKINNNLIDNNIININMKNFINKNRKNNNENKISNYPINNTYNINNNIILNKNTNLYSSNINSNLDNSIDSLQNKEMTSSYMFNNKNQIYKKRNTNESKINNSNNNNENIFNIKSPFVKKNFNNSNLEHNIYHFDIPLQNYKQNLVNKHNKNNKYFNDNISINYIKNKNISSGGNNLLSSERIILDDNINDNHSNNFINNKKRNINNKSNEILKRANRMGSPKIYNKKKLDSKNRQFIIQKENKDNNININMNNEYFNKEDINSFNDYNNDEINRDIISTNQNEFKKEIQIIYNQQKKNKVNNFDLSRNRKIIIKSPIVIDENQNIKKDKEIYENENNKRIENKYNINKIKLRLNKDKINIAINENKLVKSANKKNINITPLTKPKNKLSFKYKFYCYLIKNCKNEKCYFSKSYISKNPINKIKNETNNSKNNINIEINSNNNMIIRNEENQEITFTEKIPVYIDNNTNNINSIIKKVDEVYLNENSIKENKSENHLTNESTSNFKISKEMELNKNINNNNWNTSFSKIKENIEKFNKNNNNNQKNNDKDDLEMTFGIEDINNIQSKNINNNQFDVSSNLNDFSTINNNTNHSIVINEYINSYFNSNNNENKNNKKNEKENKKINDYLNDEDENQNDDIQIVSEDEDNKNENDDENDKNNIIKKNDIKISKVTEGKEINGDIIPNKINKGLKLLERIQIKRNSKKDFINSAKVLSLSDNKNIITNKNSNDDNLINNEKLNYIFGNELFNDEFFQKKNNTFKPKRTNKIIEDMTKNKKCEVLNDILTELFDKKEKKIDLNLIEFNIRSKTPISNKSIKNEDKEEKKYINNENNINKDNINKNTCDPKKIEKYVKIFNLNPIKNLEYILNKRKSNEKVDFINININTNNEKKPSFLTYNKKLKKFNDGISIENYLSNSNNIIEKNNYSKTSIEEKIEKINKDYHSKSKLSIYDTPKFNDRQRKTQLLKNNKVWTP